MERQGGGSVVNVASIAGLRYIGKAQVGYSAAKAALMQLTANPPPLCTRSGRAAQLRGAGPDVHPAGQTPGRQVRQGRFRRLRRAPAPQVPMGHMGDAWDVANAALFLASDESKYITAQQLVVDGGITVATGNPPHGTHPLPRSAQPRHRAPGRADRARTRQGAQSLRHAAAQPAGRRGLASPSSRRSGKSASCPAATANW